jgi:hypothetical protein
MTNASRIIYIDGLSSSTECALMVNVQLRANGGKASVAAAANHDEIVFDLDWGRSPRYTDPSTSTPHVDILEATKRIHSWGSSVYWPAPPIQSPERFSTYPAMLSRSNLRNQSSLVDAMVIAGTGIVCLIECKRYYSPPNWFENALGLHHHGRQDEAVYLLFDQIDSMLVAGRFDEIDELLHNASVASLHEDILISLLSITLVAARRLRYRAEFFRSVKSVLGRRRDNVESLLIGLDGNGPD